MITPPLDLTTERLTALRDIAKECLGASGGDWAHEPYGGQNQNGDYAGGHVIDRYGEYLISEVADVDGAHIAAFDPPTALALIARAEAAERDLAAVTVSRDGWQTRAEAAEKAVAAVRELHKPVEVYEYDDMNGVFVTDADGEQVALATLCGMCTSASVMEDVGDCEYDASGNFDEVQYPCPTITALDGGA